MAVRRTCGAIVLRAALAALLLTLLTPLSLASAQTALPSETRQFRDLGQGDLTARTMHGSVSYFFPIPPGRSPRDGTQLELVISHSTLLVPERSTMTVLANGVSLRSAFLTADNADRATIVVPLPTRDVVGGYFVQVQFHLRLTRDSCEEVHNPALWATVHSSSQLTLVTGPRDRAPRLEELAGAFTPAPPPAGPAPRPTAVPLAFVVPEAPAAAEIEAAGLVAHQIGRWAAAAGRDPLIDAVGPETSIDAAAPAVLVGAASGLKLSGDWAGLSWTGAAFRATGGDVPPSHGVLAASAAPGPRLLVSGATADAVREAADAVARPERRALLRDGHALVSGVAERTLAAGPWRAGAASFAQLGIDGRQVTGPGEHQIDLSFDRPAGWLVREPSTIELAVATSPGLESGPSWIALAVGGREIGSHRLAEGEATAAGGRRYRFTLPADRLNADLEGRPLRSLPLQVRVFLDLPNAGCVQTSPQAAWATLLPTSAIFLEHEEYGGLDLARFPAPFVGRDAERVVVVVPDSPTTAEMTAALRVMAALARGAASDPRPELPLPRLTAAADVGDVERDSSHLILIGPPGRNTLSAAAGARAAGLTDDADPAVYRLVAGEARGTLRLSASPWNAGRAVMAILGDGEGVVLAATALSAAEPRATLAGRTAVLVEELPPQTLEVAAPAVRPGPSLAPRIERGLLARVAAWQVVGAILLVAFVALVVVLATLRWLRR